MARPSKLDGKNSICWECKNYSCPWIKEGKPVKGWKAEKTKIHNLEKDTDSFSVKSCPEFLGAADLEEVRCRYCNRVLLKREKRRNYGVISVKCRRCGKNNLIFPG